MQKDEVETFLNVGKTNRVAGDEYSVSGKETLFEQVGEECRWLEKDVAKCPDYAVKTA